MTKQAAVPSFPGGGESEINPAYARLITPWRFESFSYSFQSPHPEGIPLGHHLTTSINFPPIQLIEALTLIYLASLNF